MLCDTWPSGCFVSQFNSSCGNNNNNNNDCNVSGDERGNGYKHDEEHGNVLVQDDDDDVFCGRGRGRGCCGDFDDFDYFDSFDYFDKFEDFAPSSKKMKLNNGESLDVPTESESHHCVPMKDDAAAVVDDGDVVYDVDDTVLPSCCCCCSEEEKQQRQQQSQSQSQPQSQSQSQPQSQSQSQSQPPPQAQQYCSELMKMGQSEAEMFLMPDNDGFMSFDSLLKMNTQAGDQLTEFSTSTSSTSSYSSSSSEQEVLLLPVTPQSFFVDSQQPVYYQKPTTTTTTETTTKNPTERETKTQEENCCVVDENVKSTKKIPIRQNPARKLRKDNRRIQLQAVPPPPIRESKQNLHIFSLIEGKLMKAFPREVVERRWERTEIALDVLRFPQRQELVDEFIQAKQFWLKTGQVRTLTIASGTRPTDNLHSQPTYKVIIYFYLF